MDTEVFGPKPIQRTGEKIAMTDRHNKRRFTGLIDYRGRKIYERDWFTFQAGINETYFFKAWFDPEGDLSLSERRRFPKYLDNVDPKKIAAASRKITGDPR